MQLIVITGLAGAGKSVALRALEDAGYYCIDNLPAALLPQTAALLHRDGIARLAIGIDTRNAQSLPMLPGLIATLRLSGADVRLLFLEAKTDTLVKRFSETRRSHPLAAAGLTISEAMALERELLTGIGDLGHRLDTSDLGSNALKNWVREFVDVDSSRLTLIFQSFGFKHGVPLDADFVFDARCLPNPYYDSTLRPLTGRDEPVARFLAAEPMVQRFYDSIAGFLDQWIAAFDQDNRSYVGIAIGCTGGQHRSVYLAERLNAHFAGRWQTLLRHREALRRNHERRAAEGQ